MGRLLRPWAESETAEGARSAADHPKLEPLCGVRTRFSNQPTGDPDVPAVERGLGLDLLGLAPVAEGASGDAQLEVLGDLYWFETRPTRWPILAAGAVWSDPRGRSIICLTLPSRARGLQQVLALA